jgi:hypothetical protein
MAKYILDQEDEEKLAYPIMIKLMTDQETKEYHLKKLYELSLKSLGEIPQLEVPTVEQLQWIENRMKGPEWTWQRWFVGLYFTEEQKQKMGLTDKDFERKRIA